MTNPDCDRSYLSQCSGELINRTTAGVSFSRTCERHYDELMDTLAGIGERYPEIYHSAGCACYGCSEGSY